MSHYRAVALRMFATTFIATIAAAVLLGYLIGIPDAQGFMPHGHCYLWRPGVLSVHVAANLGYATAYGLIFLILRSMVIALPEAFPSTTATKLFATFILLCGVTHLLRVVTVWRPIYYLAAFVDSAGGCASLVTVAYLYFRARPAIEAHLARTRQHG